MEANYIQYIQHCNNLLSSKYNRIGNYYQVKAVRLSKKLSEWEAVEKKREFVSAYCESYKVLVG